MDKKIAVIGSTGFVGKAMVRMMRTKGLTAVEYHVDDTTSASKEDVNACDIAFVCVPTPMLSDGSCDISIVEEVVGWLETPLIVIKSTVPVGTTARLHDETGKNIVHNPEFLREAHADHDMMYPQFVLIGGYAPELVNFYNRVYWHPNIIVISSRSSEMVKYAINSYLAYKVTFFNELKGMCDSLGLEFDVVKNVMVWNDPRIGRSHTEVTKEGGFGGHCFPKDLNALIKTAEAGGYSCEVLKSTWNHNRRFREEFAGEEFNFYED